MAEAADTATAGNGVAGTATSVLGAILAGGQSRRFGQDKAEALLHGRRLIDHVAAQLQPQVCALIVIGGPARHGFTTIHDRPVPNLGPLGGLNSALHEAARLGLPWVMMVPCDAARFPADLVARLHAGRGAAPAAYAQSRGHDHPTIGLWSASLAPVLDAWLSVERPPRERSVRRWGASVGAIAVPLPDGSIANVNTTADLAALDSPGGGPSL